ncbi:hypothetical protein B0H17DRAFT_1211295 [Mycena rosella]|uniref:HNH nuclease domain-containing protein n=1 Tax=Mycena rosella TaxID=1033263 RepID=A0AAD7CYE6_MYCRO|nr:hypothetical protein B0H17DRAFT_1211295 [Mycena rosella]
MSIFLAGGDPKPVQDTSNVLDATETVHIYHPGYTPLQLMLILVAYEAPSGQRGVPFSVVLDACRILANNQDGTVRVVDADVDLTAPDDDKSHLLPPGRYTYHVTGGEARYAVCTSFRAWTPPPVLPSHWDLAAMGARAAPPTSTASTYSAVVKMDDGRCAVTGDVSRLENSHLVPEGEARWWHLRGMNAITNNIDGINSPPNCLALRADLIGAGMDKGHLVFAPYKGTAVCVCLTKEMADFAVEYHLRAIEMPRRIHPMNVYVRFAWGLFRGFQTLLRDLSRDQSVVTIEEPNFSYVTTPERKRTDGNDARRDEQEGNAYGGDKKQGQEQSNTDEGPLLTDDDSQGSSDDNALEPPLDVNTWTERDVEIAEALDAGLDGRPLAPYEEAAGMYRGYSKAIRLKHEYRKQHPEVSAVRRARVARMGEDDDEQSV